MCVFSALTFSSLVYSSIQCNIVMQGGGSHNGAIVAHSYAHQRDPTDMSSKSHHLLPFSRWGLLLKDRICCQRQPILSFKGSPLWYGTTIDGFP